MPEFKVVWRIEIDADTAEDAAKLALEFMRDPVSTATFFDVTGEDGVTREVEVEVDLPPSYEELFNRMATNLGLEVVPYSGRGMFGEYCSSVHTNEFVGSGSVQAEWGRQVSLAGLEPKELHTDALGLGVVLYLR